MLPTNPATHQADNEPPRRIRTGPVIRWAILVVVLGLAFIGYLTPDMRVQWANLMTLCGF